jgi:enoyl-CoA hydratase
VTTGLLIDRPAAGVVRLRLDRPEKRNAVNTALADALLRAFSKIGGEVVVLGSTSPGTFCAGADTSLGDRERAGVSDSLYALYERIVTHPKPVIVAVNGHAVGGGAQLAIAGDLRVGGPLTSFRFVGPEHGLAVGTWALPSLVGRGGAMSLCLTAVAIDGQEAFRIGLVDRFDSDPSTKALKLASSIAGLPSAALARVKQLIIEERGLLQALQRERKANREWAGTLHPNRSEQ